MGRMQREKGKRYERAIAAAFRTFWPAAVVRRASQAERADNPDVFVDGGPALLGRLWLELTDARDPNPLAKLEQAERDIESWAIRRHIGEDERLPAVIWHRIGERQSHVTMRLWVVDTIRELTTPFMDQRIVTMSLSAFQALLVEATIDEINAEAA